LLVKLAVKVSLEGLCYLSHIWPPQGHSDFPQTKHALQAQSLVLSAVCQIKPLKSSEGPEETTHRCFCPPVPLSALNHFNQTNSSTTIARTVEYKKNMGRSQLQY